MDRAVSLFMLLLLFSVRSRSEEETDGSLTQAEELKRDIDYDNFIGLMGKRRAAQTDPHRHRNVPVSRKRHEEEVLADLLRRRTRTTCRCKQD